jgi:predicted nucleic acid-binding protein
MIVADSNIIVPLFVAHAQSIQCRELYAKDPDWHLPDWWQIECANVFRNYHRANLLTPDEADQAMIHAIHLIPSAATHAVDVVATLALACDLGISAYDARFIALARHFQTRLVTEDKRLRTACPNDTISLEEVLT